jgi:starch-binding outer membrane protein, SusD/RagB family
MHKTHRSGARKRLRAPRLVLCTVAVAATSLLAACNVFETDVTNPNAVPEELLIPSTGLVNVATIVNGLGASVIRAHNQIAGTVGAVSDELTWSGSREYWKLLDEGDIADPVNEYTDGQYPYLSEARWMSDYVIGTLETLNTANRIANRVDLARAYTFAGTAYLLISENYEDFVIGSSRDQNSAPVGEAGFTAIADSSIAYFSKAIALARTLGNTEWERNALGLRARARFSKSVTQRFRPARTPATAANPYLVNDPAVSADAAAALALMPSGYRFRLESTVQNNGGYFSTGFEITQRLEIRVGDSYANLNSGRTRPLDGIAGIKLTDPISGTPDPVLARAIDECCRLSTGQFLTITATSSAEMLLILAEAALASGNSTEFSNRINELRALNGVPSWSASSNVSALDVLRHGRRVNLFMQGRRLLDHHRFGDKADRWLTNSVAYRKACLFPISYNERLQNPLAPQPAVARATACS